LLFQLVPKMRSTDETEFGLWATPNTMDHLPQRSEEAMQRLKEGHRKGRSKPSNLREQVNPKTMRMWATPTAANGSQGPKSKEHYEKCLKTGESMITLVDQARHTPQMLPTPTARDYKDNGKSPAELARNSVTLATHAGGQLNPTFLEWLMGFPIGWTELDH